MTEALLLLVSVRHWFLIDSSRARKNQESPNLCTIIKPQNVKMFALVIDYFRVARKTHTQLSVNTNKPTTN